MTITRPIAFLTLFLATPLSGKTILESGFSNSSWLKTFNGFRYPPWTEGIDRASLVTDSVLSKTVLKIFYPAGRFGNELTGTQWKTYLDRSYEHATLTYRVKFQQSFNFMKGGKLPGLVGGHLPKHPDSVVSGGYKPIGTDGWSARIMWRREGKVVQYLYHPDQPGNYGEALPWMEGGKPVKFVPGRWHTVKTEIRLNTPGIRNGLIRSWLDGREVLDRADIRFRHKGGIGIDAMYFSTFFGGDDQTWATTKDEYVYFDDFRVETNQEGTP